MYSFGHRSEKDNTNANKNLSCIKPSKASHRVSEVTYSGWVKRKDKNSVSIKKLHLSCYSHSVVGNHQIKNFLMLRLPLELWFFLFLIGWSYMNFLHFQLYNSLEVVTILYLFTMNKTLYLICFKPVPLQFCYDI